MPKRKWFGRGSRRSRVARLVVLGSVLGVALAPYSSANRATARATCSGSQSSYSYESVVDVDLVGQNDPPDVVVTPYQNLYCHL